MELATHEVLSKSCHWHALPPSPRTIYEMMSIRPQPRLLAWLRDGTINRGITRAEVVALKKGRAQDRDALILSVTIAQLRRETEPLTDQEVLSNLRDDPGSVTADGLEALGHRLSVVAAEWRRA
jgi:hypothetical protein